MPRLFAFVFCLCLVLPAFGQTLHVLAATSLQEALREVARAFEAEHAGASVRLTVAASGALLEQIAQGTPADVLACTDVQTLQHGMARRLLVDALPREFATNALVLVVPAATHSPVQRLADLARPEIARIGMARTASSPAGRYAREAIDAARLWPAVQHKIVPAEDARQVLAEVARGEVQAGFVYQTDAATATDRVRVVQTLVTRTPVRHAAAVVAGSKHDALARAFVAYLASAAARGAFERLGFGPP
ncbi:MAG: molybdate ABC transporter substrate-binding protein [Rubrivivax sp.]|nr:molybdate ABC transporter substrate-binding protein [Rubrivivax sp.]